MVTKTVIDVFLRLMTCLCLSILSDESSGCDILRKESTKVIDKSLEYAFGTTKRCFLLVFAYFSHLLLVSLTLSHAIFFSSYINSSVTKLKNSRWWKLTKKSGSTVNLLMNACLQQRIRQCFRLLVKTVLVHVHAWQRYKQCYEQLRFPLRTCDFQATYANFGSRNWNLIHARSGMTLSSRNWRSAISDN